MTQEKNLDALVQKYLKSKPLSDNDAIAARREYARVMDMKCDNGVSDRELTLGSLFDGIGGWQLAAIRNGIRPVWSSEIEPFCRGQV